MVDKTLEEITMGGHAGELMANPAYVAAWEALINGLQDQRNKLPITDKDGAQALLVCERMAYKFKQALESMIQTGKFASEQLRLENERQSKLVEAYNLFRRKRA